MFRKFVIPLVSLVLVILVAHIPIFPLLVEVRSFSADGESLSQVLQFVSIPEFYDSTMFARFAWLDSTQYAYAALFVFDHVFLFFFFWAFLYILKRVFGRMVVKE